MILHKEEERGESRRGSGQAINFENNQFIINGYDNSYYNSRNNYIRNIYINSDRWQDNIY